MPWLTSWMLCWTEPDLPAAFGSAYHHLPQCPPPFPPSAEDTPTAQAGSLLPPPACGRPHSSPVQSGGDFSEPDVSAKPPNATPSV